MYLSIALTLATIVCALALSKRWKRFAEWRHGRYQAANQGATSEERLQGFPRPSLRIHLRIYCILLLLHSPSFLQDATLAERCSRIFNPQHDIEVNSE